MSFPATLTRTAARSALRAASKDVVQKQAIRSIALAASQRAPLAKVTPASAAPQATFAMQKRGVKTIDFAGTEEKVYERADWPLEKVRDFRSS